MRKLLLLLSAVALLAVASLAPKPAEALPSQCGCYCVSNPTVKCRFNGLWISCAQYAANFC